MQTELKTTNSNCPALPFFRIVHWALNHQPVEKLAESMKDVGEIHSISVRPVEPNAGHILVVDLVKTVENAGELEPRRNTKASRSKGPASGRDSA